MKTTIAEIKKLIKSNLSRIINENIQIITEKWSYSNTVDEAVDNLLSFIRKNRINSSYEPIENGVGIYINEQVPYTIFGKEIKINYYIYVCANKTICDFIYENCDKINGFVEQDNTLSLTLYMIGNNFVMEYCEKNLSHELMHILQVTYGLKNNPKYKQLINNAYTYASEIINNQDNVSEEEMIVAWLVYYSNSHEQNAFMQEYWRELKTSPSLIITKKAEIYTLLQTYSEYSQVFKENCTNRYFKNALSAYKAFGYNINNFKLMIDSQIKRLEKKIKNVENNVRMKYNQIH